MKGLTKNENFTQGSWFHPNNFNYSTTVTKKMHLVPYDLSGDIWYSDIPSNIFSDSGDICKITWNSEECKWVLSLFQIMEYTIALK